MKVLGDRVIESAEPAVSAADMWLALSQPERDATAVFASGRDARAVINPRIQEGLVAEGSVKGEHIPLTVSERVNTTRAELTYASTSRVGTPDDAGRGGPREERKSVA